MQSRALGLALVWPLCQLVLGCNLKTERLDDACIPGANCRTSIDFAGNGLGCEDCPDCADRLGSCVEGGLACPVGLANLDGDAANGCESRSEDVDAWWVGASNGAGLAYVTFNEVSFDLPAEVEVIAADPEDPACVPSFTVECRHVLHVLKFSIGGFEAGGVRWRNGTATFTGPLTAVDASSGLEATDARPVFAFTLEEGEESRRVVSSSAGELRMIQDLQAGTGSLFVWVDPIDFGEYRFSSFFFQGALVRR